MNMEESHKLTLYISYYLSRFNELGFNKLGYSTWNETFDDIAQKLNVKKHSVKNWRDEFDPIHGHRAGWHQRPMSPSRVRVVRALEGLEEKEIRNIVVDILNGSIKEDPDNLEELLKVVSNRNKKEGSKFILRGPTGRKAEEFFIEYHKNHSEPASGSLFDTRDKGCGYDFEIKNSETYYIEVKGLAEESGGVLFTNKEWEVAKQAQDKYYLVLVSKINTAPEISFIRNPASVLNPRKNIVTTIQIQWSVSANELQNE
jgi:hypothetical protein